MQISNLADSRLEHLLEAAEARLCGRGHRGPEGLLAETRRGEQCILLGMHADADVVRAAAQPVIVAPRAAVAAAVGAVRHSEGGSVVPGAQDSRVAGDHGPHPPPEAVRTGASRERDK